MCSLPTVVARKWQLEAGSQSDQCPVWRRLAPFVDDRLWQLHVFFGFMGLLLFVFHSLLMYGMIFSYEQMFYLFF